MSTQTSWWTRKRILLLGAVSLAGTALLLSAGFGTVVVSKKISPVSWGWYGAFETHNGVAMQGYDPVSYFGAAPTLGDASFQTEWQGVNWHFTSAANRDAFVASPQQYAPQHGGFCAFAVSNGFTATGNPEAWVVQDDRLYLFNDPGMRKQWLELGDGAAQSAAGWAHR